MTGSSYTGTDQVACIGSTFVLLSIETEAMPLYVMCAAKAIINMDA